MPRSSVTRRATHGLTTSSFTLDMFTRRFSDGGCFGVFDLLFPATRTLRLKGSRIAPAAEEARPAARRAPKNNAGARAAEDWMLADERNKKRAAR
eukprot:31442-Pelagococcus_subviridis.AAC.11